MRAVDIILPQESIGVDKPRLELPPHVFRFIFCSTLLYSIHSVASSREVTSLDGISDGLGLAAETGKRVANVR